YKLVGIDKGWVYAANRTTAYYTQLPPGKYNFFVKAINNDGLQGPAMQLLTIVIIPAWYQTWWFKILGILVILSLVYIFYRQRIEEEKAKGFAKSSVAELKQVKAEFEKQIAETEMVALRAQMNPHFIFNVLNSINKYILENDSVKASHYLTQFSRLIRQVLENSKSSRVPLEADLQALQLYIDMEKLRFGDKFITTIKVDKNIDQQFVQLPPLLIQPYVENAIWHGLMQKTESGNLDITITQHQENILQVIIEDNGIGREKANELKSKSATKHKSFGMQITRDRIDIVNMLFNIEATIQFEDLHKNGKASGTRVTLNIPV
nr:histidine kinase [Chitinophagaceae bacterium]